MSEAKTCGKCGNALDAGEIGWPDGTAGGVLCQLCWEEVSSEEWWRAIAEAQRAQAIWDRLRGGPMDSIRDYLESQGWIFAYACPRRGRCWHKPRGDGSTLVVPEKLAMEVQQLSDTHQTPGRDGRE